jgi:predicted PurR-regulated permease PerM
MPVIGVPLAIWMWFSGDIWGAGFVAFWTLLVKVLEGVLKPLVIGQDSPVPIWVAFLGVIGGLLAMGVIGLFIGPIILSVAYRLLIGWVAIQEPADTPTSAAKP